ncbi:DUF3592 domain-containing protein [Flavobacterium sp. NRK F7]|uniref:DUF3592 domain-containing protein n=1 Tax=Flavobacterium sp. NRK F7 TaxID=2954930 RepID=UPI002090653A|nr:DUF3592 domain-containing protein [Flavobacterium sp. NRK F7]MCO6163021.1 DUF3592 domain-containing protein [Flavobacterium sp. NRK F7]
MEEKNIMYFVEIIFIITFFVWLILVSKTIFFYWVTIKKWKKTQAIIVECEVKWFRSKTDSDTEGWKEMIRYNYTVNSREYENDCVTKNIRILTPFKDFAKKYNFSENQKIEISYDPENPKNAIIDTRLNLLTVLFPLIFYIVSYLLFFKNLIIL